MRKRILAAVDLGFDEGWESRARETLDQALVLARGLKLSVDVVYIADVGSAQHASSSQKGALELLKRFAEERQARLKSISSGARGGAQGVVVAPVFIKGDAVTKLIQLASKRAQYECLVMATHGRTGFARMLLGSVAEEVIRHSKIPVLCVSTKSSEKTSAMQLHSSPLFVIATDLGVNSRKVEKLALEWASKMGAVGLLFHSLREGLHPVIQTAYGAGRGSSELESLIAPQRERARKNLEVRKKAWERKRLRCEVILDESMRSAEDAILETLQQRGATLVFMGTHGRNIASRAFLGSTAREVVLQSRVPSVTLKS
jgi:nucleotide-binding universal stress UspA family protein